MASFIRSVLELDRDNFEKSQTTSIQKAITKDDMPTKIKHVRSIILGSFQEKGCGAFWAVSSKLPLQSNQIICWKFCHVLHKLIREGHPYVLHDSMKYISFMTDLGRLWGNITDGYGLLDAFYCKLLVQKLVFHKKHTKILGTLEITEEYISDITGNDPNGYFEFTVELLDLMDEVLNLQAAVFQSLDRSRASSMILSGQCRLYPLILSIQDSCQLYDCLVKLLFRLHKVLSASTLDGHRARFLDQYKSLQLFYTKCSNLQYYKTLVQVPTLPDSPPNFLIASELARHRKPVAIVAGEENEDEDEATAVAVAEVSSQPPPQPPPPPPLAVTPPKVDTLLVLGSGPSQYSPDSRDSVIAQLRQQIQHLQNELDFVKTKARERIVDLQKQISDLGQQMDALKKANELAKMEGVAMKKSLEASHKECSQLRESVEASKRNEEALAHLQKVEDASKQSEERMKKMKDVYGQLREEHIALLRTHGELKKQSDSDKKSALQAAEVMQRAEEALEEVRREKAVMRETLQSSAERATSDVTDLKEQLSDAEKDNKLAAERLSLLTSDLHTLKEQLALSTSTAAATAERAANNERRAAEAEEQTEEQRRLNESVSAALEAERASGVKISERLAVADKERAAGAVAVQQLEAERVVMAARLEQQSESALRADTELRVLKNQLLATLEESAKAAEALSAAEVKMTSLETERSAAVADVLRLRAELEAAVGELAEARRTSVAELDSCREKLRRLRSEALSKAIEEGSAMISKSLVDIDKEEYSSVTCTAEILVNIVRDLAAEAEQLDTVIAELARQNADEPSGVAEAVLQVCRFSHIAAQCILQGQATSHKAALEQGEELSSLCKSLGSHGLELLVELQDGASEESRREAFSTVQREVRAMLVLARSLVPRFEDIGNEVGEMVDAEMDATQRAVQEAAARIQEMLEKSRQSQTGVKLEVNERILDSCTDLMHAIHQLIHKAKDLQEEIVSQGRGTASAKDFYKKNHRWTEGLISAAKTVGWGANMLVEKAEKLINGNGKFEEVIVCSQEIAASTAQLVVSSRVKAERGSKKMAELAQASKGVSGATGNVVASAKTGSQRIEDLELLDFSNLTLHQTKRMEMNTQVHLLELESNIDKARKKLSELRKRHYQLAGESEGAETQESASTS